MTFRRGCCSPGAALEKRPDRLLGERRITCTTRKPIRHGHISQSGLLCSKNGSFWGWHTINPRDRSGHRVGGQLAAQCLARSVPRKLSGSPKSRNVALARSGHCIGFGAIVSPSALASTSAI